jgi:hypothetical protein
MNEAVSGAHTHMNSGSHARYDISCFATMLLQCAYLQGEQGPPNCSEPEDSVNSIAMFTADHD